VTSGTGPVLVLRALGLGDALTGVAPLRGVRRRWPHRRLVLAAPAPLAALLQRFGVVDDVVATTGLEPIDALDADHVAVNLHGRGPQSHRVLLATRPQRLVAFCCPAAGFDRGPAWRRDEPEVTRWCRLVNEAGGSCGPEDLRLPAPAPPGDLVVVHPGAASAARRWPAERWSEVVARLARGGARVVVTGATGESQLCAQVAGDRAQDLSGTLSLDRLAELVGSARLVLCGDTGIAHLATAFATPSVLLFGPTPPQWWGPAIDAHLHPVLWHGDPAAEPGDPHASVVSPTLEQIGVEEVIAAADELLAARR
jgi:ADP-heptose:LPS heptosyltransferase